MSVCERELADEVEGNLSMKKDKLSSIATVRCQAAEGNDDSIARLHDVILRDLHCEVARRLEANDHTEVSAASLIQGLYVRFEAAHSLDDWATKRDFYCVVVSVVASTLLEHYHARSLAVSSADQCLHPLDYTLNQIEMLNGFDFQKLYNALVTLELNAPRQYTILALRILAGMSLEHTAAVLEISKASVERDWRLARAKLHRDLWNQTYDATATQ